MGIKKNSNKISNELALRQAIFKNNMPKLKIASDPSITLDTVRKKENLTISEISKITKVNRDVISRFLDGKKINHIDYIKILNEFPQIQQSLSEYKLNVSVIDIYGTVLDGGIVRHLFLNESKEFLFLDHLKQIFTKDIIGLHDSKSSSKYILQLKTDCISGACNIFKEDFINREFLIKTITNAYYGIMKNVGDETWLCDQHTLKPIDFGDDSNKPEKIIECYDLIGKISNSWSELKDRKFHSVLGIEKDVGENINNKYED